MKDKFYFPHDTNAANDQRLLKLRSKFNNAFGYGIYFMILESMAQEELGFLDSDCADQLSLSYGLPVDQIQKIISFCIDIGLFIKDERGLWSERMIFHKKIMKEMKKNRSKAGKRGMETRWGGNKNKVITENNKGYNVVITENNKEKEIKEKKRKEKETKIHILHTYPTYDSLKKMPEEEIQKLMETYQCPKSFISSCIDDIGNWLDKNELPGTYDKPWKNYMAGFLIWFKKEAIKQKKEHRGKSVIGFVGN